MGDAELPSNFATRYSLIAIRYSLLAIRSIQTTFA